MEAKKIINNLIIIKMKKLFLLLIAIMTLTVVSVSAQDKKAETKKETSYNAEVKSDGKIYEYKYVFTDTITGKTYVQKDGNELPVFKNKTGKLYVWVKSKNGKNYRRYLSIKP